ncbi:MAG: hypothetical protein AB7I37_23240 [Pirellulales bacterium]
MTEKLPIIPTSYKAILPKTLSYPIGAEAISEGLADAPNGKEFTLAFYGNPVNAASDFHRTLREGLPYPILVAKYKPPSKPGYSGAQFMVDGGWYDKHWSLHVYPVRRELKHTVGQLLREHGLPALAQWLRSAIESGWQNCQHSIKVEFNPAGKSLSIQREDGI